MLGTCFSEAPLGALAGALPPLPPLVWGPSTLAAVYTGTQIVGLPQRTIDAADWQRVKVYKDQDAELDYVFDWASMLTPVGDQIATVEFLTTGGALVYATYNATRAVAWLVGGVIGERIVLTCRITSASNPPRVDDRSIVIKIKEL